MGNVAKNTRLNIPPINMNDGPQGFRDHRHPATTTAWPSGLTMAATWDPEAVLAWGDGMGREFYAKGANVQGGDSTMRSPQGHHGKVTIMDDFTLYPAT